MPPKPIAPERAGRSPAMHFRSVVLPTPLRPRMAVTAPDAAVILVERVDFQHFSARAAARRALDAHLGEANGSEHRGLSS